MTGTAIIRTPPIQARPLGCARLISPLVMTPNSSTTTKVTTAMACSQPNTRALSE